MKEHAVLAVLKALRVQTEKYGEAEYRYGLNADGVDSTMFYELLESERVMLNGVYAELITVLGLGSGNNE